MVSNASHIRACGAVSGGKQRDEAVGEGGPLAEARGEKKKGRKEHLRKEEAKGQRKTKGGREQGSNWRGWEHGRKKGLMTIMGG